MRGTTARLLVLLALLGAACATTSTSTTTTALPATMIEGVLREERDGLRPRCLGLDAPLNIFFRWNEADRYSRTIEATRDQRSCFDWRAVVAERQLGWIAVDDDDDDDDVFGVPLPASVRAELAQVRIGAFRMRPAGVDVDDVLALQPRPFTREANALLTDAYGHGFAGSVYARLVNGEPRNAWAFSLLEADMKRTLALGEADALAEMKASGEGLVVLVAMGFGWDETVDEHTVGYVKTFIETVQSIGVDVEVVERNTYGGLAENAAILTKTVDGHLARGTNVVIFGVCKGTPELLAAASRAVAPTLDEHRAQTKRPAGRGRVVGVVSMSGMMSGILGSDWIAPLQAPLAVASAVMSVVPVRSWQEVAHYLRELPELSTAKVERFTSTFVDKLPSDVVYIDVVGVVPDDGLLKKDIGAMGPFIQLDRERDLAKAANDGFVRYPGNQLPPGISPRHYAVIMSGSHMLFDGAFGPWTMESIDNQRALFRAAVRFVVDAPSPPTDLAAGGAP